MERVLDRGEVAEEGGGRPGEVDALEDDVLERGEDACEDDDGRGTDRTVETFGGAPVLDVPELEGAEEGRGAACVEDFTCGAFAREVCDLEMELAPTVDVR